MIILLIWFGLGWLGTLAIGAVAYDMARRRHQWGQLAVPFAVFFGSLALQHLVIVWVAARAITIYRGGPISPGALGLTIVQLLVTPSGCWLAARLLGWIRSPHKEDV